jgi:putative CocE/NonD family hydrolase
VPGGPFLSAAGGYQDDSALAERPDVLTFTSRPLTADLFVLGTPAVELCHSSDNPNVDVFARISEVDARGKSRNVTDGYRRLTGSADPAEVRIELDPVAHRFPAGSRLRLHIAGGSHPRFSRNTGTGESPWAAEKLVPATHTVHHGPRTRLILPTTDGRPE